MSSPIPFEIMAIITALWVLIGAFKIAPWAVWQKLEKHGATPKDIKQDVVDEVITELTVTEMSIDQKIQDFQAHVDQQIAAIEIPEVPEIPDLDLKKLYEDIKELMAEDINILQENLPTIVVNSLQSKEGQMVLLEAAKASAQSISGAIYREMGIDKERAENGIKMTKEWFVNKFEKVTDPKNQKVAALKHILAQIFPDEGTDWVDEKIAAIREIQILLQPSNGSENQHYDPGMFRGSSKQQVIASSGMQG